MKVGLRLGERALHRICAFLLGLAVLYQSFLTVKGYILPEMLEIRELRSLPARERTALLLEGQEFLEYLRFLQATIPEDARVILPPRRPPSVFSNIYYVQYYLFPRDLHNCGVNEVEACIERVTGSNTYILALQTFPPRDLASQHKVYLPFNGEIGVFVPSSEQGQ